MNSIPSTQRPHHFRTQILLWSLFSIVLFLYFLFLSYANKITLSNFFDNFFFRENIFFYNSYFGSHGIETVTNSFFGYKTVTNNSEFRWKLSKIPKVPLIRNGKVTKTTNKSHPLILIPSTHCISPNLFYVLLEQFL